MGTGTGQGKRHDEEHRIEDSALGHKCCESEMRCRFIPQQTRLGTERGLAGLPMTGYPFTRLESPQ
jgi:hypothetical protein